MRKYKAILFDLDGTLCDTDEMIVQTFFSLYKKYKPVKVRERAELYYFSGPPIKKTVQNEFPDYPCEEVMAAFREISKSYYLPYVKPYKDEIEMLHKLKEAGYLLGVVTNKGAPLTKYSLEICHLEGIFDVVISADDVASPKPEPLGIFKAMEKLGMIDRKDVLYVGDNDIDDETAKNAGVDSLLVTWGPREIKRKKLATYLAASYLEMGDILL